MSRLKGDWRPRGYEPTWRVWLRQKEEGGALRSPGEITPPFDARTACTVLVHGFNNHAGEAANSYTAGFRKRQYGLNPAIPPGSLEPELADVYWPGDADWPWLLDKLDFLIYPVAVGTARSAAPLLADALLGMPNLHTVRFVGHSLGCRLILETVDILKRRGRPAIDAICLMAAAVPCEMVEPGGEFDPLLRDLVAGGTRIHLLHSKKDTVLRFAFPAGQALAGPSEASARALGYTGPPPDMVGRSAVTDRSVPGAGHGDYWGHNVKSSAIPAEEIRAFLRIGGRVHTIPQRTAGESRNVGHQRPLGTVRSADAAARTR